MARTSRRILLALCAFAVLAVALTACGGVPGNSVAKVNGSLIKKSTFDHWLAIAAASSAQGPGAKPSVPDAPNFTKCIAAKLRTQPKPAKGQKPPSTSQLKAQCMQEYNSLRDQVLQFLISAQWIQGEAADQGVKVTDADVKAQFAKTKKQSFPKPGDFEKFLARSGMSMQDILFRVKLDLLSNKLRMKVTAGAGHVTQAQIAAYYNKNRKQFAQPERRDLEVVLTKTKAQADKALAALKGGTAFATVAKKFSIDQQTKANGGKLIGTTKGQQDKALDQAAFSAKVGKVVGPVKAQFGYYLFKVAKITPASQQTLAQARTTIRQLLVSQGQQMTLQAFVKKFQKKWKSRTECRKGFVTQDCSNAPKPKPMPQLPPGAVPQGGGGAQQVPVPQGGGGAQQVPVPQGGGGAQQVPVPQGGGGAQQVPVPQGGGAPPPSGGSTP